MMIRIKKGKKSLLVEARKVSFFGKFRGLMFRHSNTQNLLFEFSSARKWAIHSYFVFFPFMAIWLDRKNNVVDYRRVEPFEARIVSKRKFNKLVEVPITDGNSRIIRFLVGKRKV